MKNRILLWLSCWLLIAGTANSFAAPIDPPAEGANLLRHLETMNSLTRSQMQLDYERLRNDVHEEMGQIKNENAILRSRLDRRDGDMSNYIDAISWVSGVVIGFVGILFGIGAFILYRENQGVTRKAQEQLDLWNERAASQENTFDQWFQDAKTEHATELDQLGRIMRLRILLDQENPSAQDIFPELSPLYSHPKLEYLPIFKKVMTLDIDADIRRSTQAAIDHLTKQQRADR
jgi:hypothetical protein